MSTGNRLAQDMKTLIAEHGVSVTFRRVSNGVYDPATGTTAAATTDDETIKVAFLAYSDALIDGANIIRGDRKAIFAASGLSKTPQAQDQFIDEGSTVNIVDARVIQSGGVDLVWICQVRL